MVKSTRNRDPWREDLKEGSRFARAVSWRVIVSVIGLFVVIGLLGAGIWYLKVLSSDVKGAGDATRITNDAQNRINAQQEFHDRFAAIKAADRNLDTARDAVIADKNDKLAHAEYRGLTQRCQEMVQKYNADTQKITRGKWRDASLPYEIDDSDTATDCKPSK